MSSKRTSTRNTKKQAPIIRVNPKLKLPPPNFNVHHEDIRNNVEVAFEVGKKKFYRCKEEFRMPAGRYKYVYAAAREVDLRMDMETLKQYVAEFKKCLNPQKQGKPIDIETLWKLVFNLETRTELHFEPATVKKLASVVYFDDTEELDTWDKKHAEEKIAFWEKNNCYDFFLTRPIEELLNLKGVSITSLEEYIQTAQGIVEELTSGLSSLSQANSSENGKKTS